MTFEEELAQWTRDSRRFRAFAEAHGGKIRKKLRGIKDPDALRDVRAELLAGRLLLADRRFELAYEAYGVGNAGPDFTVTFRGGERFNVEVTRLRGAPMHEAFVRALMAKLRQLPSGVPNLLLVAVDADRADASAMADAARALRLRADRKDEAFFERGGFVSARAFYQRFLRLSAVLVWAETSRFDERVSSWVNPSARIGAAPEALRALVGALRLGSAGADGPAGGGSTDS
jgi:hypothetical protein